MDESDVIKELDKRLKGLVAYFSDEIAKLRPGQAHPSLLDGVVVDVYESQMPLIQLATVVAKDNSQLQVTPFDANNLNAIRLAISNDNRLDFNPTDDGKTIYVPIPPLTGEKRQQIVKLIGQKTQDALIQLRQARHEALKVAKSNDSEAEASRLTKEIEVLSQEAQEVLKSKSAAKEAEILKIGS